MPVSKDSDPSGTIGMTVGQLREATAKVRSTGPAILDL